MTSKADIRSRLAERRQALPIDTRRWLDARIAARAEAFVRASGRTTAMLFAPSGGEPDITAVEARVAGTCRIAYPRVRDDGQIEFRLCRATELSDGWRGLQEPPVSSPLATTGDAVAFVPALAVSPAAGARIGRGGGHYDRVFAANPEWIRVAVVYDFQLTDEIVAESHDEPMDGIVTPSMTYLGPTHPGSRLAPRRTGEMQ